MKGWGGAAPVPGEPLQVPWFVWLVIPAALLAWLVDWWARHPDRIPGVLLHGALLEVLGMGMTTASASTATCIAVNIPVAIVRSSHSGTLIDVAFFTLLGGVGLSGALVATIRLFGRPRFLIPPPQRRARGRGER